MDECGKDWPLPYQSKSHQMSTSDADCRNDQEGMDMHAVAQNVEGRLQANLTQQVTLKPSESIQQNATTSTQSMSCIQGKPHKCTV